MRPPLIGGASGRGALTVRGCTKLLPVGDTRTVWFGRGWRLELKPDSLLLEGSSNHSIPRQRFDQVVVMRRTLRWYLFDGETRLGHLRGIKKRDALSIALQPMQSVVREWVDSIESTFSDFTQHKRWIPVEVTQSLIAQRPVAPYLRVLGRYRALSGAVDDLKKSLARDLVVEARDLNEATAEFEIAAWQESLSKIESRSLTKEQMRAIVAFDNRVQVVAAAGSGKTSVIVARICYAILRGFVKPEEILVLTYNKAAAQELQSRLDQAFQTLSIGSQVKASTFHAYGLKLIQEHATMVSVEPPRVSKWAESPWDLKVLQKIVDDLKASSEEFSTKWESWRLLFGDLPLSLEKASEETFDDALLETFDGTLVRSHGERLIANWLFLHHVDYEYERVFSSQLHLSRPYRPDFYYPAINVWHEHWALDRNGRAPENFVGYGDQMKWKRNLHQAEGSDLIETTFHDVVFGGGLGKLKEQLESFGLVPQWDPNRPRKIREPVTDADLVSLIRSFLSHVKSGGLTRAAIEARLAEHRSDLNGYVTSLFLELFWPVFGAWNALLRTENSIDFDDMLLHATELLRKNPLRNPYKMVLVDEFQDTSLSRADLLRQTLSGEGHYLLAVGDDWQSIYRFAGSDISVMTQFEQLFGLGLSLKLSRTFRCPQAICDASSSFIAKNKNQIVKTVISMKSEYGEKLRLVYAESEVAALAKLLNRISQWAEQRKLPAVSVFLLGRYNFDSQMLPSKMPSNLNVRFLTVHSAKGLEADFIIIVNNRSDKHGFPSRVADHPILSLATSLPDSYEYAEERRLFYVAMTRARIQAALIATHGKESEFVVEMLQDGRLSVLDFSANPKEIRICSKCMRGTIRFQKVGRRWTRYCTTLNCSGADWMEVSTE